MMAVGCGAKCAKAMLILFNIIFWLSGCALLGVGIWLRVDQQILRILGLADVASEQRMIEYASYLIIAVGAFVFLVGYLGCCGAMKENKCCLGLYIFFLVIVMAAELAAGILILVYKEQILAQVTDELKETLQKNDYVTEEDKNIQFTAFGSAMNYAQAEFKCCGVSSYSDYSGSNYTVNAEKIEEVEFNDFPFSCCKLQKDTNILDLKTFKQSAVEDKDKCKETSDEYFYDQGCNESLEQFVSEKTLILVGIGIGIACLEIFGFIFAVCLCRNTGDE